MPGWRNVRGNKSTATAQALICFDTETNRTPHPKIEGQEIESLRLGVARYARIEGGELTRRQTFRFQRAADFWGWLHDRCRRRECTWIVAHNLGFDLTVLEFWRRLADNEFALHWDSQPRKRKDGSTPASRTVHGTICLEDPPTILRVRTSRGAIVQFVDSLNYWRMPLKTIGAHLGLEKLEMPSRGASQNEWFIYCERDVEILETALVGYYNWVKANDLGMVRSTVGAQAYGAWRHRWMPKNFTTHDFPDVRAIERAAYYGGELACFYYGQIPRNPKGTQAFLWDSRNDRRERPWGPVHRLDVTGLYPSVMHGNVYPRKLLDWDTRKDAEGLDPQTLTPGHIARVVIETRTEPLSVKTKTGVLRAIGCFTTVLAGPELIRARDAGAIQLVRQWARYELTDLFSPYVEHFWSLRQQAQERGDLIADQLCKSFLNSLYGKFAQWAPAWKDLPGIIPPEPWGVYVDIDLVNKELTWHRSIAWHAQQATPRLERPESSPAVSAFVTAHARERMRALRQVAGEGNYYYQGIDSLFCSPAGLRNLERSGEVHARSLGRLRLEETADDAEIFGYNHYRLGEREIIASIRSTATRVATQAWRQEQFDRLASILASEPVPGVPVRTVTANLRTDLVRGSVDEFGWVHPTVYHDQPEPLPETSDSAS
jgi:DNA polymerase type B, organellar and viral